MAGFTADRAQSILTGNLGKYVGLLTGDGTGEPTVGGSGGYARGIIQNWNTTKSAQVANDSIIFMFEALQDYGDFSYFGLFSAATGGSLTYTGKLTGGGVSVGNGTVPLIRTRELIIGLDKVALESY